MKKSRRKKEINKNSSIVKMAALRIIIVLVILGLNWAGLSAMIETFAYLNDIESSSENIFAAAALDFSLGSPGDFSPAVTPTTTASRNISIINEGSLGFEYTIETSNESGELCDDLYLKAYLDSSSTSFCEAELESFICNVGEFEETEQWDFVANQTGSDPALENQSCNFDFVFDGVQIGGAGFYDQETINNTINSGQWVPPPPSGLKINEVYYDVLESKHCKEAKNEWVELYNPTNSPINLKKWKICHAYGKDATCNTINANVSIPAFGYAAIGHDNSTWVQCFPNVPQTAVIVHQLGGPWPELGNDGDYIILKNPSGTIVDCVSWGDDPNTCDFPDGTVGDVVEGYSIARQPAGYDTDRASDWVDLLTPNPGTNPHDLTIMDTSEIIEEEVEIEGDEEELILEEFQEEEDGEDETSTEESANEEQIISEQNNETSDETDEEIIEEETSETGEPGLDEEVNEESATEENSGEPDEEVSAIEEQPVSLPDEQGETGGDNNSEGDNNNNDDGGDTPNE